MNIKNLNGNKKLNQEQNKILDNNIGMIPLKGDI